MDLFVPSFLQHTNTADPLLTPKPTTHLTNDPLLNHIPTSTSS